MADDLYPLVYLNKELLYLRNKKIMEYDIASGGYSCSLNHDLLSDSEKAILLKLNKKDKQIFLGNKARDEKEFTKLLHLAFREEISNFVNKNTINENNILSIKKDSITLFNSNITYLKNNNVTFIKKMDFTSYLLLGKLEFYYNGKTDEKLVKGLSLINFEGTLVEEIFTILKMKEYKQDRDIYDYIKLLRNNYLKKDLINSYYKELSPLNAYRLNLDLAGNSIYLDDLPEERFVFLFYLA